MKTLWFLIIYSVLIQLIYKNIHSQVFWDEAPQIVTVSLNSVSDYNAVCAWVCGDSGTVIKTTNRGYNWAKVSNGIPNNITLVNIFAVDENLALTAGYRDSTTYVYRTTNAGANWTLVFSQVSGFINGIWMSSSSNGFMEGNPVANRWSLWKTTNGGLNWDSSGLFLVRTGNSNGLRNSIWGIGSAIWFGTNNNIIYYTASPGSGWTSQNITPLTAAYSIWYEIPPYNWAYAGGTVLMKSLNSGTNWTVDTLAIGSGIINGIAADAQFYQHIFYIRNNPNIYLRAFYSYYTITYTAPNGIYNHIAKTRSTTMGFGPGYMYAVRNNGRISRGNAFVEGVKLISGEIPSSFSISQNYPNPFNSSTKFKFTAGQIKGNASGENRGGNIRLSVYNIQGKEIEIIINKIIQPGIYEAEWDAGMNSSGIYFYRIEIIEPGSGKLLYDQTKKMILLK